MGGKLGNQQVTAETPASWEEMLFSIPEFCPGVSTCLAQRADGSPTLIVHKLWDALLRGIPGEGQLMAG